MSWNLFHNSKIQIQKSKIVPEQGFRSGTKYAFLAAEKQLKPTVPELVENLGPFPLTYGEVTTLTSKEVLPW